MTLLDPRRTAAVHIDMQGAVLHHAAEPIAAAEVVTQVSRLVDAVRKAGGLNIFVRTSFLPDESDALRPPLDHERPKPYREAGWNELVDEIEPLPTEPVIVKRSWNAFHGSDLDLQLRRHGIDTVLMSGISTNFGVEGTARAAYDHGYRLIFITDAMASNTAANHDFAVRVIFPQLGRIRDVEAVLAALRADLVVERVS